MIERDADAPGALRDSYLQLHARLIQCYHARLCGLPELAIGSGVPEVRIGIKLVHVLDQRAFSLWGKCRTFHGRFLSFPRANRDSGVTCSVPHPVGSAPCAATWTAPAGVTPEAVLQCRLTAMKRLQPVQPESGHSAQEYHEQAHHL